MASGKKNYFRHSFFASEDPKIQQVIETMGFEGYGFYFSLLELCGRHSSEEVINPIVFHIQTIRKVWRKNTESTKKVLRKLEESGLFLVTFSEHSVSLDIPSFGKYLGRYDLNASNKRKEKEIKQKETPSPTASPDLKIADDKKPKKNLPKNKPQDFRNSKEQVFFSVEAPQLEEDLSIDQKASNVLTIFNALTFKNFRPVPGNMKHINARLKEGYALEDFKLVISHKYKQWVNNPEMAHNIRPETILGNKFDGYLQSAQSALKPKIDPLDALAESYGIKPFNEEESA